MKKHLKLISLLSLFIISATSFFIFAKRPGEDKPETVVVRVFQKNLGKRLVWTDYGNSKIEQKEIDGFYTGNDAKSSGSTILSMIQNLNSQGYKVVSQAQSVAGEGQVIYETWVLTPK